ncbi:MAG: hypothetical protein ABIG28_02605 [archaeon]
MAEKEMAVKEKVGNTGLFDFAGLYRFAHSWFRENEYGVNEDKYVEKVKGNKKDIRVEWLAMKDVSDYFKFEQKIIFSISGMAEVEVEIEKEKKKMNQGNVEVEITGTLIRDKDSKWDTSPFSRFMRDVYNKFIIPSRVDEIKNEIRNDVKSFKEQLKAFMELSGRR